MSAPTGIGLEAANFEPIALPMNPDAAWPLVTDDTDAGPFYTKAIAAWTDDEQTAAQQFMESPQGPLPDALRDLLRMAHRLAAAEKPKTTKKKSLARRPRAKR